MLKINISRNIVISQMSTTSDELPAAATTNGSVVRIAGPFPNEVSVFRSENRTACGYLQGEELEILNRTAKTLEVADDGAAELVLVVNKTQLITMSVR